jgi:hypothetical protein
VTGYHCLPAPRIWRGERLRRDTEGPQTDPYGPDRPAYRERTRETATDIGNGLTRMDIGEPLARAHGSPQPVSLGSPIEPSEETGSAPAVSQDIQSVLRATSLPEFKPGLGRG